MMIGEKLDFLWIFSPRKIESKSWWCPGHVRLAEQERARERQGKSLPIGWGECGLWRHGNARSSLVAARLAPHAELAPLLQPHSTHLTYFFCVFSRDYGPYSRCSNGRICLGRLWHKTFTPLLSPWQPLTEYLNFPGLRPYSSHSLILLCRHILMVE